MIIVLRHCESIFNASGCDLRDCALSDLGEIQAKNLEGNYDLVIVSPLKRARQTLELSNIIYNELNVNELAREHKTDMCDFLEGEQFVIETEKELLSRIEKLNNLLAGIIKKNTQGYKILLISHYDIIWYMTSIIINKERFGVGLDNGEINHYAIADE